MVWRSARSESRLGRKGRFIDTSVRNNPRLQRLLTKAFKNRVYRLQNLDTVSRHKCHNIIQCTLVFTAGNNSLVQPKVFLSLVVRKLTTVCVCGFIFGRVRCLFLLFVVVSLSWRHRLHEEGWLSVDLQSQQQRNDQEQHVKRHDQPPLVLRDAVGEGGSGVYWSPDVGPLGLDSIKGKWKKIWYQCVARGTVKTPTVKPEYNIKWNELAVNSGRLAPLPELRPLQGAKSSLASKCIPEYSARRHMPLAWGRHRRGQPTSTA